MKNRPLSNLGGLILYRKSSKNMDRNIIFARKFLHTFIRFIRVYGINNFVFFVLIWAKNWNLKFSGRSFIISFLKNSWHKIILMEIENVFWRWLVAIFQSRQSKIKLVIINSVKSICVKLVCKDREKKFF